MLLLPTGRLPGGYLPLNIRDIVVVQAIDQMHTGNRFDPYYYELAVNIPTARIPEELIMLLSDVQSVVGSKHWCAFGAIPNRLLL